MDEKFCSKTLFLTYVNVFIFPEFWCYFFNVIAYVVFLKRCKTLCCRKTVKVGFFDLIFFIKKSLHIVSKHLYLYFVWCDFLTNFFRHENNICYTLLLIIKTFTCMLDKQNKIYLFLYWEIFYFRKTKIKSFIVRGNSKTLLGGHKKIFYIILLNV